MTNTTTHLPTTTEQVAVAEAMAEFDRYTRTHPVTPEESWEQWPR